MNVLVAISQVRFRIFVITTGIGILLRAFIVNSLGVGLESLLDQGVEMDLFLPRSPQLLFPSLGLVWLSLIPIFLKNKDEAERPRRK